MVVTREVAIPSLFRSFPTLSKRKNKIRGENSRNPFSVQVFSNNIAIAKSIKRKFRRNPFSVQVFSNLDRKRTFQVLGSTVAIPSLFRSFPTGEEVFITDYETDIVAIPSLFRSFPTMDRVGRTP